MNKQMRLALFQYNVTESSQICPMGGGFLTPATGMIKVWFRETGEHPIRCVCCILICVFQLQALITINLKAWALLSSSVSAAARAGWNVACRCLRWRTLTRSFSFSWSPCSDPLLMESSTWPEWIALVPLENNPIRYIIKASHSSSKLGSIRIIHQGSYAT